MAKRQVSSTKPAKAAKPKGEAKPKGPRRTSEETLIERYPQVSKGTLRFETVGAHANKQTVEIGCQQPGCRQTRRVATSDLFQSTMCNEHRDEARKAARAAYRLAHAKPAKAKVAKAAKPAKAAKAAAKPVRKVAQATPAAPAEIAAV